MTKSGATMFAVCEFLQECGECNKLLVGTDNFATREEAERSLKQKYQASLASQENRPGVWSRSFDGSRYTIDNNDGDFLEGAICEKCEAK
jgi:hypothetical protein